MPVTIQKGASLDGMNMTPMIDVVFNLLIFFLVATQFADEERSLAVQLPASSEARPLTAQVRDLFVNIDREGRFYVGSRQVTREELHDIIARAAASNPGRQSVKIRPDKLSPVQQTVFALDACVANGIRNYSIETEK